MSVFLFFSFRVYGNSNTIYIHGEKMQQALQKTNKRKNTSKLYRLFTSFLFYRFGYLFLVMSYLGDRRHKWQTITNSAETGSCLHEIQDLCNHLWLISQITIQELWCTEPAWLQQQTDCIHIISRGWRPGPQVTQIQDGKSGSSNSVSLLLVLTLFVCFQLLVNKRGIQ